MIPRYSRPEMAFIWTDEHKMAAWLEVEIAACEAWAAKGMIPAGALAEIKEKANFDVERVRKIEKETRHDVIAFLTNVGEHVGEASKYIHYGMTSSDMLDTGLALQLREATDILLLDLRHLLGVLKKRAFEHRDTVMIGRSHGIHAEPVTFGLKLAVWCFETARDIERLRRAREVIAVGQISGAVGTYALVPPEIEEDVCRRLELTPAPASTQIIQRDRHAEYLATLAIIASTVEKMAVEIRHLQRTEVLEAEEPFKAGQKGSSAMPHKRNPIISERMCGQARVIRGNAMVALENNALWHERDISHSSAERVILPDSTILLDYMLYKWADLMENLVVYPERMRENLEASYGLVFSQSVLLKLIDAGLSREEAYRVVQTSAMKAWQERTGFKELLLKDETVKASITEEQLESCFDPASYLENTGVIFERLKQLEA
ncbi:MAG: adenylosuccinate lyase [Thermoleophilia bacterium]|nr:adenylosuccinate lyase [Thermoleophilia bacterium]